MNSFIIEPDHYTMGKPMDKPLNQQFCEPCQIGTPPLTESEENQRLVSLTGWALDREEIHSLSKTFGFTNFVEALGFVNKIGELAEKEQHHPEIALHHYKKVTITLYTHKIKGLSHNDFIMAAKIDSLVS